MKTSNVNAHMYFKKIVTYNNYKQAMFLILGGPERWFSKPKLVAQL